MKLYILSSTHWDREWYQPFQGFRKRLVDFAAALCNHLEQHPEFGAFHFDGQTVVLEDIYEIRPDLRPRFEALIAAGRVLVGPWYVMPDEFLVSGEALIRNLAAGHRLAAAHGGRAWKFGYLCDSFGHIAQLPQVLKGFGIDYALLGRGTNEHSTAPLFAWRAPDGSEVITVKLFDQMGYPAYWLEQTGHPAGTPPEESWRGIDGLRCDFAQGLPSQFWEYCINRTRAIKWDFLFMAESLDGYREVNGSKRHGVGYRSSRHFDILNENMVFYWRDSFFAYPANGCGSGGTPDPTTGPTQQAFDNRRNAYEISPILLNLSGHDEVLPSHDPWRVFYVYAELAAMDGVPMLFYGQEAGLQNDHDTYNCSGEIPDTTHNFDRYELNFGKSIPNFKRYNSMRKVWENRGPLEWRLQAAYGRANNARLASPALRSQGVYFLSRKSGGGYDPAIFAVARFEAPGVSAATQDVVFAFVNNNYWTAPDGNGTNLLQAFEVAVDYDGRNWFGIEAGHTYNVVDLLATNPAAYLWETNKPAAELFQEGLATWLRTDPTHGGQAQYIKLVDMAVGLNPPDHDNDGASDYTDWDDDNDGLPDWWERDNGLNPTNATGLYGADGDKDGDGATNAEELRAGTHPNDIHDVLEITGLSTNAAGMVVEWAAKPDIDYEVEHADDLRAAPPAWSADGRRTGLSATESLTAPFEEAATNRFWRIDVIR